MTQWKIGDRAEVIEEIDHYKKEDIITVIDLDGDNDPIFDGDSIKFCGWAKADNFFHKLTAKTALNRKRKETYETIQINGKLYNLIPVKS